MDIGELYKVEDIVFKEIKTITDNGKFRSREEIDNVYKLVDILRDIKCFEDEGYSEYDNRYDNQYDGRSYEGRSYRRRRDSMGRYASEGSYRRRYSRDEDKGDFKEELERLLKSAPDEQTERNIQRMINDIG